jgi:hypothetical protein
VDRTSISSRCAQSRPPPSQSPLTLLCSAAPSKPPSFFPSTVRTMNTGLVPKSPMSVPSLHKSPRRTRARAKLMMPLSPQNPTLTMRAARLAMVAAASGTTTRQTRRCCSPSSSSYFRPGRRGGKSLRARTTRWHARRDSRRGLSRPSRQSTHRCVLMYSSIYAFTHSSLPCTVQKTEKTDQ